MRPTPTYLVILALLIFPIVNLAGVLQLHSGNLTLSSDKGDSTLLKQAEIIIRLEQKGYELKYGLRLEKELAVYFYYDKDALGPRLHAVPYWSGGIARSGSEIHIYGQNRTQWLSTLKH